MPAHKLGDLLASSGALRALSREARHLARLQQVLFEAVPPPLTTATRVKSLRAGTLILITDHAAAAAKLRQLAPRLLLHVQKRHTEVTGIRIEVQVRTQPKSARAAPGKSWLPIDAIEHFRALAERVQDSPLRSALARLVRRNKGNRKSGTP
jgi:hypothetical protein